MPTLDLPQQLMKLLVALIFATLALPAPAFADDVTMQVRDVPLHGGRTLASASPTPKFDMVGLHWKGGGSVQFQTRSLSGRWSRWQAAAPESEDQPDVGTPEARTGGWRLGNPYWAGNSDAIRYRLRGDVRKLRAYFLDSRVEAVPLRELSIAGLPALIPRSTWGANEQIRRHGPHYAPSVRFAIVHHTAGTNNYTPAQSAAIVRGIQRYHVLGNGWDDIGYNFLIDKYGQVFEGRYGGIDKSVIGAHAQGFNDGSVGVAMIGTYSSTPISASAEISLANLLAWRLDVAHVDPLSTLTAVSTGNPRFPPGVPVFLRAISGHRDTGFTSCPGGALYAQLPAIARNVAETGLPKLYTPRVTGSVGKPVRITARLSAALQWTVTVTDHTGAIVASGAGFGTAVDWTWDATHAKADRYSYTISASPDVRPATGPVGKRLPRLAVSQLSAKPVVVSPDGDKVGDATTIVYRLTVAASVTIRLVDPNGTALATLFTGARTAGTHSFDFVPSAIADGRYRIEVAASSNDGQQATVSAPVVVDRTLAGFAVSPFAFSPNGDGVNDTVTFSMLVNVRSLHTKLQIFRGSHTVATVSNGVLQPGQQTISWAPRRLPDGHYRAVLTAADDLATQTRALLFTSDTTSPRLTVVSFARRRFKVSEAATIAVGGHDLLQVSRAGAFTLPERPPAGTAIVARDAAGNTSKPLAAR